MNKGSLLRMVTLREIGEKVMVLNIRNFTVKVNEILQEDVKVRHTYTPNKEGFCLFDFLKKKVTCRSIVKSYRRPYDMIYVPDEEYLKQVMHGYTKILVTIDISIISEKTAIGYAGNFR